MPKITTTVTLGMYSQVKKYGFRFSELIVEGFHEKMRRSQQFKQTDLLANKEVNNNGEMDRLNTWRKR